MVQFFKIVLQYNYGIAYFAIHVYRPFLTIALLLGDEINCILPVFLFEWWFDVIKCEVVQ